MAVRRLSYSQVLERELAKGTSLSNAMKIARGKTAVKSAVKKPKKRSLLKRVGKFLKKREKKARPIGHWAGKPLKRKKR